MEYSISNLKTPVLFLFFYGLQIYEEFFKNQENNNNLYFTGSKEFNFVMRARALSMGFSLNEHGFSLGNKKKISWNFPTEESIFEFLGMVYKTPEKRINGTAVKDI